MFDELASMSGASLGVTELELATGPLMSVWPETMPRLAQLSVSNNTLTVKPQCASQALALIL